MTVTDILLIEKETETSDLIVEALMVRGYSVETAAGTAEAVERVRERPPRLILGSISISGENFLAFCRTLRNEPDIPDIPVIVILPERARYEPGYGESYGIVDAMVRPVDLKQMLKRVTGWLEPSGVAETEAVDETLLSDREKLSALPAEEIPEEPEEMKVPKTGRPTRGSSYGLEEVSKTERKMSGYDDLGPAEEFDVDESDPASKLARDLRQSVLNRRRNRIFSGVAILCSALLLAGIYLFMSGDEPEGPLEPSTSAVRSSEIPADSAPPEDGKADPFREMIDADLAREAKTAEPVAALNRAPEAPAATQGTAYRIQAGAFLVAANAETFAEKLRATGYEVEIVQRQRADGRVLSRVLVGRYPNRSEASEGLRALAAGEGIEGLVVRH